MTVPLIRGRSFAANAMALSAAQLGAPVLNGALVILMARWAGPEALGGYSLLVTAFMVVDQLRLFGLQRLITRELAAGRAGSLDLYRGFLDVTDVGGFIGFVLLTSYGMSVGVPPLTIIAFSVGLIPSARVWANDAVFLALGRADFTARVVVTECTARVIVSVAILWFGGADLAALGATYAGGRLLAASLGARYRRRLVGALDAGRDWSAAKSLVAQIPAFFAVTALPLLLLRADLLVVGAAAGARDLGFYGGAARLVAIALLVPDGIMLANFARLSRGSDVGSVRRAIAVVSGAAILLLVPLAAIIAAFATPVARLVYGSAFAESGRYLAWLVWSVPLFILCRALGDALIATGHQGRLAWVILGTTIATAPVYVLLTRAFGPLGTAMAYLGSLLILLAGSAAAAQPILAASLSPRARPTRAELSLGSQ